MIPVGARSVLRLVHIPMKKRLVKMGAYRISLLSRAPAACSRFNSCYPLSFMENSRVQNNVVPYPYGTPRCKYVPWSEAELIRRFPAIAWREPQHITTFSGFSGWACRICVARHGIYGYNVNSLPQTREEFEEHMRKEHPVP